MVPKKKKKGLKKSAKAKRKPIPGTRKSPAKSKKAAARKPKSPSRTRRAAAGKEKEVPSRAGQAPRDRRPVTPKKASALKTVPFSETLKEEISTVLVTGAGGCVGNPLVRQLLRDGYSVIATDRKEAEISVPAGKNTLVVKQGDLADPAFAASCLEGVDAVFHPGRHADGKPLFGAPEPSPVSAARALYRGAREAGVKRFILITSAAVYGRHHGPVSEEVMLEARDEYEHAQGELEGIVLEDALPGLPSSTVLRPAAVYGPGCMAWMASLATLPPLVKTLGPCYIPLSGGPRTSLVHAEDVARAAVFLLLHPKAYAGVFNVADNDPMPFGHFLNTAMQSYGLKPLAPGVAYPPSTLLESILPCVQAEEIFNPLGKLSNVLWERIVRRHRLNKALLIGSDRASPLLGTRELVVDNRKLLGLGFRLKYPHFRRGWEKTLAWYLKKRWIPRPEEL